MPSSRNRPWPMKPGKTQTPEPYNTARTENIQFVEPNLYDTLNHKNLLVEARKLEHQYPHSFKVNYRGSLKPKDIQGQSWLGWSRSLGAACGRWSARQHNFGLFL